MPGLPAAGDCYQAEPYTLNDISPAYFSPGSLQLHDTDACFRVLLQFQRVEDSIGDDVRRRTRRKAFVHGAAGAVSKIVFREGDAQSPGRIGVTE